MMHSKERQNKSLLEHLAVKCNCDYISDLRFIENTTLIVNVIMAVSAKEYPSAEWIEAIHYFLNSNTNDFKDQELLKNQLIEGLKNR